MREIAQTKNHTLSKPSKMSLLMLVTVLLPIKCFSLKSLLKTVARAPTSNTTIH